jgi:hypothetical protein
MVRVRIVVPMTVAVLVALGVAPAGADQRDGFITQQAAMLAGRHLG